MKNEKERKKKKKTHRITPNKIKPEIDCFGSRIGNAIYGMIEKTRRVV